MAKEEKKVTSIKPLNDRVLVKVDPVADKIGNILLPDNAKEKPCWGRLISFGADCAEVTQGLVGKTVFYHSYSGSELPNYKGYVFLREGDLLGYEEV